MCHNIKTYRNVLRVLIQIIVSLLKLKIMSRTFFPVSDAMLLLWAMNYKEKIGIYATVFGMTPEDLAREIEYCDAIIASVNRVGSKNTQYQSSVQARTKTVATEGGALRANIGHHKTAPNYTEVIGLDLGIVTHNAALDFANYKAKISAELYGGMVRIKFRKMYADGINLYRRKKGGVEWGFVARVTKSPFDYSFVLEVVGQPEHWEYRAFGVVDDTEVGFPSDIVEVIYGI